MTEIETAIADNRAAVEEFIATARAVDPAAWTRPRAEGQWSPAQIVEHLAIVYEYSRSVVMGTAGKGMPRLLQPLVQPLLRRMVVNSTLKAGKFTRKGKAPGIFQPSPTPGPRADLIARLNAAVSGFEGGIRSGHPESRHAVQHPYFGRVPTTDFVRLQAIHARHHRAQLPSAP
ncbi:MAG TPA: DinB family protein [Vicinamibacterales bacterium]|nr:DinB family protein [Vicinamibacterales bacterium]